MDSVGNFRGQWLTLEDKLQGKMSVDYRGYIYLLQMSIIKRFNFLLMRKASECAENTCMTAKKLPCWLSYFSKLGKKYFQASFCNDEHILQI